MRASKPLWMLPTLALPALALLSFAPAAEAQIVQGRLEMQWGDPSAQTPEPSRFNVTLVEDGGRRQALDPAQALQAADDLYALFGRRVAVGFARPAVQRDAKLATGTTTTTNTGPRRIDAIVPIGDLTPDSVKRRIQAREEAIAGTSVWVTLMCKFSDMAGEQKTVGFFQAQYGSGAGQLDHYWQEVSYGQINLAGSDAYGWATLPSPRGTYVTTDTNGKQTANLGQLFRDCVAAHDAQVNFAANGGVQGINMMFNGDLDGFAWGGSQCTALDGINKCWSTTWNPPWSFGNLAPLSHEMGHGYGLPHANNSDGDSDPYDNPWDVMSDAWSNAVSNVTYGSLPKHISMYHRDRLGWVAATRKLTIPVGSSTRSVTVDRASLAGSTNRQMLILSYPSQPTKYYAVEVRKRGGTYENKLAGDAVIIHEVVTNRSQPAWSMDADTPPANRANNEGSMFKVGETWTSPDYMFRVSVEAATVEGFVLSVRPPPIKGGPSRPVQQAAALSATQATTGTQGSLSTGTSTDASPASTSRANAARHDRGVPRK